MSKLSTNVPSVEYLYPSDDTETIVSIQPIHAKNIYQGSKRFELRKSLPRNIPSVIYLYETNGTKKITGHIVVSRIHRGTPSDMWKVVGTRATTRQRYFDYFSDADIGYAFEISRAVKYREPITLADIRELGEKLSPPQNFVYVDNYPRLQQILRRTKLENSLWPSRGTYRAKMISPENEDEFTQLVIQHISGSYKETGEQYAKTMLEISHNGKDIEGVLSTGKHVLEIYREKQHIGYVVATEKIAGNIKTGPFILRPEFRNNHEGQHIREFLREAFTRAGYRKVYATAPAHNKAAILYLLASGYKIEAHLRKHYHDGHDELVFGQLLQEGGTYEGSFVRNLNVLKKFSRLGKFDAEAVELLQRTFSEGYSDVTYLWASDQVRHAISKRNKSAFKPRFVFVASSLAMDALALCVIKRGGSAKILLLTETEHRRSLIQFVQFVESKLLNMRTLGIRKFYTHVPVYDPNLLYAFQACGYRTEGVLERSYRGNCDYTALGKALPTPITKKIMRRTTRD